MGIVSGQSSLTKERTVENSGLTSNEVVVHPGLVIEK
jgi:hypothetical protein